jgi:mannose-6-phosphate isomerase-like protein (cupin superfamily)
MRPTKAGSRELSHPLRFTSQDATAWRSYEGTTAFDFPYDKALIVTKGRCTVEAGSSRVTAGAGEVLYLPAHVAGTFHPDEDSELVYVASSPYGAVNREAKRTLLNQG